MFVDFKKNLTVIQEDFGGHFLVKTAAFAKELLLHEKADIVLLSTRLLKTYGLLTIQHLLLIVITGSGKN